MLIIDLAPRSAARIEMDLGGEIEVSAIDEGYSVREIHIGIVIYERHIAAVAFKRFGYVKAYSSRYAKFVEAPAALPI